MKLSYISFFFFMILTFKFLVSITLNIDLFGFVSLFKYVHSSELLLKVLARMLWLACKQLLLLFCVFTKLLIVMSLEGLSVSAAVTYKLFDFSFRVLILVSLGSSVLNLSVTFWSSLLLNVEICMILAFFLQSLFDLFDSLMFSLA